MNMWVLNLLFVYQAHVSQAKHPPLAGRARGGRPCGPEPEDPEEEEEEEHEGEEDGEDWLGF